MDTENTEQATIPKEISSYKLAKHDATNIKQQIDNKKNISITLGNNTYDLGLVPNPTRSDDFKAVLAVNGKHIEVPLEQVNTYKGIVIGQDFSDLRITISRDGISGFIKTENDDKFYIEPLRNFKPDANRLDHVVCAAKDIKNYFELGDDFTRSGNCTNRICVLGSPCIRWKHTVMWVNYMGDGAMMDIFSDGTVSASQNNEQTIRNNAVYINNNILPH